MRKKKNLSEKLMSVSDYLTVLRPSDPDYRTSVLEKEYLDFKKIFKNDNPVLLEIGSGKGRFITEAAKRRPDKNFLAVEVNPNIIYAACRTAKEAKLKNVYFIETRAEYLTKYIGKNSVDAVFLNFSCPYPKKKYESHRLTSERFLDIYKEIMSPGAKIYQKTDNPEFFAYSIENFSKNGFILENVTLDLHKDKNKDNIMTEYEEKFVSSGLKIYALTAYLK